MTPDVQTVNPQNTDSMFQAIQNQIQKTTTPPMHVGLQESIIDAIPLIMGGISGDTGTMNLVKGIVDRRRQQEEMMFQNNLDLRKLQLDAATKGIMNEREKLESAARIGAEQARTAQVKQETEQSATMFQPRLEAVKAEAGLRGAELAKNVQETKAEELRVEEMMRKSEVLDKYKNNPDPESQAIYNSLVTTGHYPTTEKAPPDLMRDVAASSARGQILVEDFKKGNLEPAEKSELQGLMENYQKERANPKVRAVDIVMAPLMQEFTKLAGSKGQNLNLSDTEAKLNKSNSNKLLEDTITQFVPHYENLVTFGLRDNMREQLQSILDRTKSKFRNVDQVEKTIYDRAKQYNAAEGQAEFLKNKVGKLLDTNMASEADIAAGQEQERLKNFPRLEK